MDDQSLRGPDRERGAASVTSPAAGGDAGPTVSPGATPTLAAAAASEPVAPARTIPEAIGEYRVVDLLGEGGMGVVYEAEQASPHRRVALKVMRQGHFVDEAHARMFHREAETLGRLKHPGIAAIYESGHTDDGHDFFAMELVAGRTLDAWLAGRPVPVTAEELRLRLETFRTICDAVHYAHQRGVIHRDLKPANIVVADDAGAASPSAARPALPAVKILDFGLARLTDVDAEGSLLTETGMIKGTLAYMAPEQAKGMADAIDVRTDVYALGMILYEMLALRRPYDVGRSAITEAVRVICDEPPRPLAQAWRGTHRLDPDVATIVGKALEKEPDRRYGSAAALSEDVERFLASQPIVARPPSVLYHLRKMAARHRLAFASAGAIAALLAAGAVGLSLQAHRIALERDRANREKQAAAQVSDFLVKLFRVSRPDQARGSSITARELLDKGTTQIRSNGKMDAEVRATLLSTMGDVYSSLGIFDRAGPLLEDALRTRRSLFGNESAPVAETLRARGILLQAQGRDADSVPSFREALAIYEKTGGPESLDVAQLLNDLGNAETRTGHIPEAEAAYERAVAIRSKVEGPDATSIVPIRANLGLIAVRKGDLPGAERAFRAALAAYEKALPADHPDVALLQGNVGATLVAERKYADAEPFYRKALATHEKVLGGEHPQVAQDLANIAEVHRVLADLPDAEHEDRRALAILRSKVPATDLRLRFVLVNLSIVLDTERAPADLREAEGMLREAVATNRSAPPPDPWDAAKAESELGGCLLAQGRLREAEPLLVGSFPTLRDRLGVNERARVDVARDRIVELYRQLHEPGKAAPFVAAAAVAASAHSGAKASG